MIRAIMHGCNGKMGQMIAGLIAADEEIELVAGVDTYDEGKNSFPVFKSVAECTMDLSFFYFTDQRNRSEIYDGLFRYLFFE